MDDIERMRLFESAQRTKKQEGRMTMSTKMIPVSVTKLERELSKRNLRAREISVEMGYQEEYLPGVFARGTIAKSAALLLDKLYDIRYEEYEPDKPKTAQEAPDTVPAIQPFEIDYKRLYDTVFEAVYQGVKKAWEND